MHQALLMDSRYEVIRGTGPNAAFVELCDRSLAPGGLAFEVVADEHGSVTVAGYQVRTPFEVVEKFLQEARSYLAPELGPKS